MRRQAGASDVDLDAEEGFALLTVGTPNTLDLPGLITNVKGAGYTTTTLQLVAEGTIVEAACPRCKKDTRFLEIAETGQHIEIQGPATVGDTKQFKGSITGWSSDHPVIELMTP